MYNKIRLLPGVFFVVVVLHCGIVVLRHFLRML